VELEITISDEELETLLGSNPFAKKKVGSSLHISLNEKWNRILKSGLSKPEGDQMKEKYPVPENSLLGEIQLNPELNKLISSFTKEKDDTFNRLQMNMSISATILGGIISSMLSEDYDFNKSNVIKELSDAGRYLCGTIYYASFYRRKQIKYAVQDSDVKEALNELPIYPYFFGNDLKEKVKEARVIKRAKDALKKPDRPSVVKKSFPYRVRSDASANQGSKSAQSLNSKRPPHKRLPYKGNSGRHYHRN